MKLDKGSFSFNIAIDKPGNTPSFATPLGTKKKLGYPIDKEGAIELIRWLDGFEDRFVFGGFDEEFHEIVKSYRVDALKVDGEIVSGNFFLLLLNQIKGRHKGRKTLKYSKETGNGRTDNLAFFKESVLESKNDSVMVSDLEISNGYLNLKSIKISNNSEVFKSTLARDFSLQYSASGSGVSLRADDIILVNDTLMTFAFELFNYLNSIDELERVRALVLKSEGSIKEVTYSAYKLPEYFGSNTLFAGFDQKMTKQELTTGRSQRYSHVPIDIDYLAERFIYFNYQWSFPSNQTSVTFEELKTFVNEVYHLKIVHLEKDILNKRTYALIKNNLRFPTQEKTIIIRESKSEVVFDDSIFVADSLKSGLYFDPTLNSRFLASLQAKPFVILSGLSGSGKTKLAESFAMYISESEEQWMLVPVGADWTNRDSLLGFENTLTNSYSLPPYNVPKFIERASREENRDKPYFLILDEMNLSIVERYFADFLSAMESSNKEISLHQIERKENEKQKLPPNKLKLPTNLFIIGTVNIDESTYMFSPKVLDRANTIEFRLKEADVQDFLNKDLANLNLDELAGKGKEMAASFLTNCRKEIAVDLIKAIDNLLIETFKPLKRAGAEFGYRTISEIRQLATQLNQFDIDSKKERSEADKFKKEEAIFDIAILQKLLPKLHGSVGKLRLPLTTLAELCFDEGEWDNQYLDANNTDGESSEHLRYPLSFEKIKSMYVRLSQNGFVSFAEA